MKCYLINLDRAPERLARMQQLLDEHGVEFERVAAVDARTQNYDLLHTKTKTPGGEPGLVAGDIACGASHLLCMRRIAAGEHQYAAILEDDLHLAGDISFFLQSDHWLPADADLVKLETFRQTTLLARPISKLPNGRSIARLLRGHSGASAYIVSKKAAQRIINEFDNRVEYIDVFLFKTQLFALKTYQVNPAPAIQHTFGRFPPVGFLQSGIHPDRHSVQTIKSKGWPEVRRKTRRLWGLISYLARRVWFKVTSGKHYGRIRYRS